EPRVPDGALNNRNDRWRVWKPFWQGTAPRCMRMRLALVVCVKKLALCASASTWMQQARQAAVCRTHVLTRTIWPVGNLSPPSQLLAGSSRACCAYGFCARKLSICCCRLQAQTFAPQRRQPVGFAREAHTSTVRSYNALRLGGCEH